MNETTKNPSAVAPVPAETLRPAVDVIETEEAFLVIAELPGVDEDGLQVTLEGDVLSLQGTPSGTVPEGYTLAHREIPVGRFERTFCITTEVETDAIDAKLEHGLLRVRLPKAKPKQRRIQIRTS